MKWRSRQLKLFCILSFLFLCGCGSVLCTKGETNQGLYFNYGSTIGIDHIDIGSEPTHKRTDSWVKIIIVEREGFLLVTSQGMVHCDNMEEMRKDVSLSCKGHKIVKKHKIRRYIKGGGYEEWSYDSIPEKEWKEVTGLYHPFSKKPDYHYKNCRNSIFGQFIQLLQTMKRA